MKKYKLEMDDEYEKFIEDPFNIKQLLLDRRKILISMDINEMKEYMKKYKVVPPSSDEVLLIGMHKARCECLDVPVELQNLSANWLSENGYYPGIGGIVANEDETLE